MRNESILHLQVVQGQVIKCARGTTAEGRHSGNPSENDQADHEAGQGQEDEHQVERPASHGQYHR